MTTIRDPTLWHSSKMSSAERITGNPTKKTLSRSRFDSKRAADPFAASAGGRTRFASAYAADFPARIAHGGTGKNTLRWSVPLQDLDHGRMLVLCAEGLVETTHPHSFVARQAFEDVLAAAPDAAAGVVAPVALSLRAALGHKSEAVRRGALSATRAFARAAGPALTPQLRTIVTPLSKLSLKASWRDDVMAVLQEIEELGGKPAYTAIKSKVPTYVSINI